MAKKAPFSICTAHGQPQKGHEGCLLWHALVMTLGCMRSIRQNYLVIQNTEVTREIQTVSEIRTIKWNVVHVMLWALEYSVELVRRTDQALSRWIRTSSDIWRCLMIGHDGTAQLHDPLAYRHIRSIYSEWIRGTERRWRITDICLLLQCSSVNSLINIHMSYYPRGTGFFIYMDGADVHLDDLFDRRTALESERCGSWR